MQNAQSGEFSGLLGTLNMIEVPMFLVAVEENGTFRFGGINRAHENQTGMRCADIAGRTPHEVLPPRTADTVISNYRRCAEQGEAYSYEEILELPGGNLWWRTTLSPVFRGGRVVSLIGTASDITRQKQKIGDLIEEAVSMRGRIEAMQALVRATMNQTRGPLNNILALAGLLRLEFRPPVEQKEEVLEILVDTAVRALDTIEEYEAASGEQLFARSAADLERVDFGHLCRHLSAVADPSRKLSITFPEADLLVDGDALSQVLNTLLVYMSKNARSWIGIAVSPNPRRRDALHLHVRSDLLPAKTLSDTDEAWIKSVAATHGWALGTALDGEDVRGTLTLTLTLQLPGRLVRAMERGSLDLFALPVDADTAQMTESAGG